MNRDRWMRGRFYLQDFLKVDLDQDSLFRLKSVSDFTEQNGDILASVQLVRQIHDKDRRFFVDGEEERRLFLRMRTYSEGITRLGISIQPVVFWDDSPILQTDSRVRPLPCSLDYKSDSPAIVSGGRRRITFDGYEGAPVIWGIDGDGAAPIARFQSNDRFFTNYRDALPLWLLEPEDAPGHIGFSLSIADTEHFAGTGERFDRIDLFGRTIDIVNENAHGVNGRRAYKNVPLLLSSKPYGVFNHSPAAMKLDIGNHSSRSMQWLTQDEMIDLFFIDGGDFQTILQRYQYLTGVPPMPPTWSFGVWMSKATYESAEEVETMVQRMRAEGYPLDVVNLDTGWTEEEWKMDWQFGRSFSPPERFFDHMKKNDVKVCLWEYPYINPDISLDAETKQQGLVGQPTRSDTAVEWGTTLDFTNPKTVQWYKDKLRPLAELGVRVFKTDFGENIDEHAQYAGMDGRKLHNLYALLYQKATYELLQDVHGEAILWARPGFAGCQRYPLHWSADCSSTYDGMTQSIWGGLHLGLSGFAYWSHDVGGFYDLDTPFGGKPDATLLLRWVQHGIFTSHFRFHGMSPREPWQYPDVAEAIRQWLRFRMMLLPYILQSAQSAIGTGLPIIRALVFRWPWDPAAWQISDQYMFGDAFLVCPLLDPSGRRDVYLPDGTWVDFWQGETIEGPRLLPSVDQNGRPPLYVPVGTRIEFAEPVASTEELQSAPRFFVTFDDAYTGFDHSEIKRHVLL